MTEKRKEYLSRLLDELHSLEERVQFILQRDELPFSFFTESFKKTQEVSRLLQELESLQIEEMKHQMERLILLLSEAENQSRTVQPLATSDDQSASGNRYSEGFTLPEYKNPRASGKRMPSINPQSGETQSAETKEGETPEVGGAPKMGATPKEGEVLHPGALQEEKALQEGKVLKEGREPKVGELPKQVAPSLNEMVKAPTTVLDLKRSISLNDRFLFQRELFHNNREEMNEMMARLNAFDHYEEAENYLRAHSGWDFDNPTVEDFLQVIKKGFE